MTPEPNSVRPDEVLTPGGNGVQVRQLAKDAVLLVPNFAKLVARLLADPRVPRRSKIALGMAAAYVASPIDLVPEFIPVLGWLDDLLILSYVLDRVIERAGPELVAEHWDGPGDLLGLIRDVLGLAGNVIPRRLRIVIDRLQG
ncbi:MAG TPA: YkvA family protein [Acidimicrobiia bacterium]|nr:YkvA family protein [Acidimicrobiia bacterium]